MATDEDDLFNFEKPKVEVPEERSLPSSGGATQVPHYALPNFTTILPDYINQEQDMIRQAYQANNYKSLSRMPNQINTSTVSKARLDHIERNLKDPPANEAQLAMGRSLLKVTNTNGLFQEFEYIPSRYTLADEIRSREREVHVQKIMTDKEGKSKPFFPVGVKPSGKYEDPFLPTKEEAMAYRYPTNAIGDPFEAARDEVIRQKWLSDSKILSGPFRPSGANNRVQKPTRLLIPEILLTLEKMLEEDWGDSKFDVQVSNQEDFVIRFEIASLDSQAGLLAYMNIMARSNDIITSYNLKKVVEDWGREAEGLFYFAFRPPWITTKMTDAYYNLHPEERHSELKGSKDVAPSPGSQR